MLTFISSAAYAWALHIATTERRRWREKKIKNTLLSNSNTIVPFFSLFKCVETNCDNLIQICVFECIFMTSIICIVVVLKCCDLCCFSLQKIDKYTIVSFVCDISTDKSAALPAFIALFQFRACICALCGDKISKLCVS